MSEISSIGLGQGGVGRVNRADGAAAHHRNGVHAESKPGALNGDRVDLSDHARLIAQLRELPDVRSELVEHARQKINDPGYLSDERLNVAIERLLDDIGVDESL